MTSKLTDQSLDLLSSQALNYIRASEADPHFFPDPKGFNRLEVLEYYISKLWILNNRSVTLLSKLSDIVSGVHDLVVCLSKNQDLSAEEKKMIIELGREVSLLQGSVGVVREINLATYNATIQKNMNPPETPTKMSGNDQTGIFKHPFFLQCTQFAFWCLLVCFTSFMGGLAGGNQAIKDVIKQQADKFIPVVQIQHNIQPKPQQLQTLHPTTTKATDNTR